MGVSLAAPHLGCFIKTCDSWTAPHLLSQGLFFWPLFARASVGGCVCVSGSKDRGIRVRCTVEHLLSNDAEICMEHIADQTGSRVQKPPKTAYDFQNKKVSPN